MWNLMGPPAFQGLRDDLPISIYERNLPHWRQDGATYFVTFRLADSLPKSKLDELKELRANCHRQHTEPLSKEDKESLAYEVVTRIERWLDRGFGNCVLKNADASRYVVKALHYFDGDRYKLGCYAIMPNHVHLIVKPEKCARYPLERLLQTMKVRSAIAINKLMGTAGQVWQEECYDRIVRNEEHLFKSLQYIGNNPLKAGVSLSQFPRWISPEWQNAGWDFDMQ